MSLLKSAAFLVIFLMGTGCLTTPKPPVHFKGVKSYAKLSSKLHKRKKVSLKDFSKRGPFKYKKLINHQVPIAREQKVLTDLFIPKQSGRSPLIIMSHGNKSFKESHRFQAERLATWGFNVLVLQLPNQHQWLKNGSTIQQVANLAHAWPSLITKHIDPKRIILVGHSFGGSAVTIAAGSGAPVKGLILLDPAVVHDSVVNAMQQVNKPVILLGADKRIFKSRRRELFFKNIPGEMLEISIRNSTHNDAQYPTVFAQRAFGFDPEITEALQEKFVASIISSAFSLANTNSTYFAWNVFKRNKPRYTFKQVKIKSGEDEFSRFAKFSQ